jgi:murein DD-endopeptidase MepM/ murein hydrolase activator NlpD
MQILLIRNKHGMVEEFELTFTKVMLIMAIVFALLWSLHWLAALAQPRADASVLPSHAQHPLANYAKLDERGKLVQLETYVMQLERRLEQLALQTPDVITRYQDLAVRNPFLNEAQGGGFRSMQQSGFGGELPGVQIDHLAQRLITLDQRSASLETAQRQDTAPQSLFPLGYPLATYAIPTSTTGYRPDPFTGQAAWHDGIDLPASYGTAILATGAGLVTRAGWDPELGNVVEIEHASQLTTRYAHAQEILVTVGQKVNHGQTIAKVGSTGRSTGPHLHYEILRNTLAKDMATHNR